MGRRQAGDKGCGREWIVPMSKVGRHWRITIDYREEINIGGMGRQVVAHMARAPYPGRRLGPPPPPPPPHHHCHHTAGVTPTSLSAPPPLHSTDGCHLHGTPLCGITMW